MKTIRLKLTSLLLAITLVFTSSSLGSGGSQTAKIVEAEAEKIETAATVSVVKTASAVKATDVAETVSTANEAVKILTEGETSQAAAGIKSEKQEGVLTECGGNCDHCPTIVVPGISQTETFMLDENGDRMLDKNGKAMTSYPPTADVNAILSEIALPFASTLITQRDFGFTGTAAKIVGDVFSSLATGLDTQPVKSIEVVKYPQSVALCSEHDRSYIYSCIPLQAYSAVAGEDHLYFLAYNSFGNNLEIAKELYDMIQQVKRETGHNKVNLAPISLGATIMNSLMEFYPQVYTDINKVVFIAPALDGSVIVSDIYKGNLSTGDEMLYKDLFPSLFGGYLPHLINIALRLLPKQVVLDLLDKVLAQLQQSALVNCTVMWGLVPNADYPALAEKFLSDAAHAEVRRQTDLYYRAQKNSDANILKMVESGIKVFDVVDYNFALYSISGSYKDVNADGVIHLDSTSMGAASGPVNTPLPAGYVQQNTHCTNPAHNHISPNRIVDASTGLLPDQTFYFYNQAHEGTARDDVVIKLATEMLLYDNITDVYSMPERFPQFNVGRESKWVVNDVRNAKLIDQSTLSAQDAAELQGAIDECDAMLNNTVVDYDAFIHARDRLNNIRYKIGAATPPADDTKAKNAEAVCKFISEALYKYWGPRGFSDWNL